MGGGTVDWTAFTWEAFATLVAGLVAVIGAVVIGLRQAKISAKQTEILSRQIGLQQQELRVQLYERRMRVYVATKALLFRALNGDIVDDQDEAQVNFVREMDHAPFLFQSSVTVGLEQISSKFSASQYFRKAARDYYRAFDAISERDEENDLELKDWMIERYRTLSDLFSDELSLAGIGA